MVSESREEAAHGASRVASLVAHRTSRVASQAAHRTVRGRRQGENTGRCASARARRRRPLWRRRRKERSAAISTGAAHGASRVSSTDNDVIAEKGAVLDCAGPEFRGQVCLE